LPSKILNSLRSFMRAAVYKAPLRGPFRDLMLRLEQAAPSRKPEFWDQQLAGEFQSYLGGTITVEGRNALVAVMLRHYVKEVRAVLDVGCASGSLAKVLKQSQDVDYTGVDISEFAISQTDPADGDFFVSSLDDFSPKEGQKFSGIVVAEVLYYLDPASAVENAARLCSYLDFGGVLVVSMKNDVKSEVIFRGLEDRLQWVGGIAFQEHPLRPRFRTYKSREYPAYLLGIFRENGAPS